MPRPSKRKKRCRKSAKRRSNFDIFRITTNQGAPILITQQKWSMLPSVLRMRVPHERFFRCFIFENKKWYWVTF